MRNMRSMKKQKGLAMFISLMMLLLMTLIIVHAARSSSLEILMGNNAQHAAQALMRAEDSVMAGEELIEFNYDGAPNIDFSAIPSDGLYIVGDVNVLSVDWTGYPAEQYGVGDAHREYIVEYLGPVAATGGSLSVGAGASSDTRYLYRISGRGISGRGGARVVQTIYATAE